MYDIALCEEDSSDAAKILNILDDYEDELRRELRVRHFTDAESLIQSVTDGSYIPDIIMTGINLPGISGIEAVKKLRAGNFSGEVIFITASENYALEAWELCARQYIIKPATKDKIFSALGRIFPARKFIIVRQRKAVRKIFLNEILYCETHGKYQAIITRSEEISVRITARDMRKLFAPPPARVILLN